MLSHLKDFVCKKGRTPVTITKQNKLQVATAICSYKVTVHVNQFTEGIAAFLLIRIVVDQNKNNIYVCCVAHVIYRLFLCVLFCTIIFIIFTSLCKNFLKLTCVLAEAFRCHGHHSQCLTVLVELAAMFRFHEPEVK